MIDAPRTEPPHAASAFVQASGLQLGEVSPTRVTAWADLGPDQHTPWGIVHGGVYATAAESAASIGASTAVAPQGRIAVGVSNLTNFLRPMTAGRIAVTATAIQQGRVQQLWQVDIVDEAGRLVATSQVRLQNVEPRA